jgi:hypothetical protein
MFIGITRTLSLNPVPTLKAKGRERGYRIVQKVPDTP